MKNFLKALSVFLGLAGLLQILFAGTFLLALSSFDGALKAEARKHAEKTGEVVEEPSVTELGMNSASVMPFLFTGLFTTGLAIVFWQSKSDRPGDAVQLQSDEDAA